jgi:hypothetical protein
MTLWITLTLLALAALIALLRLLPRLRTKAQSADAWPVYAKQLLSAREQVIYHRLKLAYPQHLVLAQVALSQLIGTKRGPDSTAVFNRYGRLVADFVVCSRDFKPLAVFELDGDSHDSPKRADADARKTKAVESAGLPLLRLNTKQPNDEAYLHSLFPPPAAEPASHTAAVTPVASRRPRTT